LSSTATLVAISEREPDAAVCAEIGCVSPALQADVNPTGGSIEQRPSEGPEMQRKERLFHHTSPAFK